MRILASKLIVQRYAERGVIIFNKEASLSNARTVILQRTFLMSRGQGKNAK